MVKHILVVDDERSVAFLLSESLAQLSPEYQVQMAYSSEDALDKIAAGTFDLVITDLRMPGMDGLDLIRRVHDVSPGIRIILITAYGNDGVEKRARHLSVYRYITKPFKTEELMQMVEEALLNHTPS
jgi:CheY-like chemotaxis protein